MYKEFMDETLSYRFESNSAELNNVTIAVKMAKAMVFSTIHNLPEALDRTIEMIEYNKVRKAAIAASTESGSITKDARQANDRKGE
jgi:2-phospho-L-lactate transferase/gluconeogenesis factor (CofD/UPF0052 family)